MRAVRIQAGGNPSLGREGLLNARVNLLFPTHGYVQEKRMLRKLIVGRGELFLLCFRWELGPGLFRSSAVAAATMRFSVE